MTARRATTYHLELCPGLLDHADPAALLDHHAGPPPARRLVVLDAEVSRLYGDRITPWLQRLGLPFEVIEITASEPTKTRATADQIHAAAVGMHLARRDEILAIGGGIVLDLAGFAAAELRKGTPYVAVPTTLVGLIDASLGGKRAVNQCGKKNLIGAYHPARTVLLDPGWLATLDKRQIRAGLAEIKKVAEMVSPNLLARLHEHGVELIDTAFAHDAADEVLRLSIGGILDHLAHDLYEEELCRWPDYGHTISPALEMATAGQVNHGEAVNICAALAGVLAAQRGFVHDEYPAHIAELSHSLGLPTYHPLLHEPRFVDNALAATVLTRGGDQHWPVPALNEDGHAFIEDAKPAEIRSAVDTLRHLTGALA
ncbi:iron-containing alcohol dehydrogenase [Streptomyces sp. 5K101]|uniref:iron-containing alcohol dehydrogenase n=1 Tax=Streptomyces sp. 5K101 TaxID=3390037 RepID=UPI0039753AC9